MGKARNARGAGEEKNVGSAGRCRRLPVRSRPTGRSPGRQHPDGHDAYVQSWRDAHELSQEYATAVHAGNTDEARRLLDALMAMADQRKSHPDFPAAVHEADTTAER